MCCKVLNLLFFEDFIYLFSETGEGREKGRETSIGYTSCTPPTGDLAGNPGMCSDLESNLQPFSSQAGIQSTELHQPGQVLKFLDRRGELERIFATKNKRIKTTHYYFMH